MEIMVSDPLCDEQLTPMVYYRYCRQCTVGIVNSVVGIVGSVL